MARKDNVKRNILAGRHMSLIPAAEDFVRAIRGISLLRVSPGVITPATSSSRKPTVKLSIEQGSIKVAVRGKHAVQILRVYGSELPMPVLLEHIGKIAREKGFEVVVRQIP